MGKHVDPRPHYGHQWRVIQNDDNTFNYEQIDRLVALETRDTLLAMKSGIDTIRHFFHQPGMARAVQALIAATNRKEVQRQTKLRAQRRKRRLAKKAAEARR